MRLLGVLAALVALSAGAEPNQRCRSRTQDRTRQCGGEPPFRLYTEYAFSNPGTLPTCTSATHCVALCKVNRGGTAWECVDNTGAAVGTVTQGTGTTYQQTPFGVYAMSDITSAKAPRVVSATLDPIWKADHTVVMGGYGTTLTSATFQHWTGGSDGTNTFYARNDSGAFTCAWVGAGGSATANNAPPAAVDGWAVTSCRRQGTNYYSRTN